MESEGTAVQESFETQVGRLREHPAYSDRGHYQHKEIVQQVENLYKEKHGEKQQQQDFQPEPTEPTKRSDDGGNDASGQYEAVLEKFSERGINPETLFAPEFLEGEPTPEKAKIMNSALLAKDGKFDEFFATTSRQAYKAGYSAEFVRDIAEIARKHGRGDDPLTQDWLFVYLHHISRT